MSDYKRPSRDEYFMEMCRTVATRGTCDRVRLGCVITDDNHIIATGYNGSLPWFPHCDDVGHLYKKKVHEDGTVTQHCERTMHAEQNAICQAAKRGVALGGATLYCKLTPCSRCAMLIISCGIKRIVCEKKYHAGQESEAMFAQAGISMSFFDESIEQYANQK
jgi:dCMP deaminase